jgi:putative Mn2+ efflux pump MntP
VAGYRIGVFALLFAAVAVGLSNLAASIGIGVTGVTARTRLQVGLVFGVFEAGMPIVGLLIGQRIASDLGQAVRWPGAILLMIVGASGLVRSLRESRKSAVGTPGESRHPGQPPASRSPRLGRLLVSGFVLSLDNLVVGFALGTYQVAILTGAILIGAVSVTMSLAGLELGGLLGRWAGQRSEQLSGLILILVGAAIAGGALS